MPRETDPAKQSQSGKDLSALRIIKKRKRERKKHESQIPETMQSNESFDNDEPLPHEALCIGCFFGNIINMTMFMPPPGFPVNILKHLLLMSHQQEKNFRRCQVASQSQHPVQHTFDDVLTGFNFGQPTSGLT